MGTGEPPSRFATWAPEDSRRPWEVVVVEADAEADVGAAARLAERYSGISGEWEERLRDDVADRDRALFVAKVNEEVIGYSRMHRFVPAEGSPADSAPAGWYLGGLVVATEWRRRGAGEALTRARLDWVAERATEVWYYANAGNRASLALHAALGFKEVTREFTIVGVSFGGGGGVLCRKMFQGP
ncbi:MAG: GNAT family N-acetyltransferase [Acidimicrobiales bacterium]